MKVGDKFKKKSGYTFIGEIRAVLSNRAGETRIVGELVNEGGNGDTMLHIFLPSQIEIIREEPIGAMYRDGQWYIHRNGKEISITEFWEKYGEDMKVAMGVDPGEWPKVKVGEPRPQTRGYEK